MRRAAYLKTLAAVCVLGACGTGSTGRIGLLSNDEAGALQRNAAPVRAALLDTLEVTREATGATATLSLYAERDAPDGGRLRIWRSADGAQIVLRDGVLIATRGLGNDLGSAEVRALVALVRDGDNAGGRHQLYVLTGENGTRLIDLSCGMQVVGLVPPGADSAPVTTRHVRADCIGAGTRVTYDLWVDPEAGSIWRSRQWAGPGLGYIVTRRLEK